MSSGQRSAGERLRRLLVILPWLMERGEVPVADAAAHFGLSEAELTKDLEMAAMCGLPPFVDELIDVFIDDGMIFVGVPRLFTRPLGLNSVEAFELLAAARVAMQLQGADVDGPLGRGLRKLATALGEDDTGVLSVELMRPEHLTVFTDAVDATERLRIQYVSASSDEPTERTIVPRRVYSDRGAWYVLADDDKSGEFRTFRVDRIVEVEATGEHVEGIDEALLPDTEHWFADGSIPRAKIRFDARQRGVIDRYPVDELSEPDADGFMTAVVPVVNEHWLATTLLRLGADAEVLEPDEWVELRSRAAAELLSVYR